MLLLAAAAVQAAVTRRPLRPIRSTCGVAGVAIGAGSLTLAAASVLRFRAARTTVNPFEPHRAASLVTTGANAITRNPMYVGMAGLLAAHAVARGSVVAAVRVAAFIAAIDRWQIRPEEAALRDLFGAELEVYRAQTPRWLGRPSVR